MNLLLSIILCVAMAVSGTGQLSAVPDSMPVWTISNVSIGYGNETVKLDKEAVIRGAVCEKEAQLSFHINDGDRIMLPLGIKMSEDELMFSLGSGGRAYSLTNADILEFGEITDEEERRMIDECAVFIMNLGRVLGNMHDAEYAQSVEAWSQAVDDTFFEETAAAEVDIDGVLYQGEYRKGSSNDIKLVQALENMKATGIPELDDMLESMETMMCTLEGVNVEKGFAGLAERYGVDADELPETTMEQTIMEQDGLSYNKSVTTVTDDEGKSVSTTFVETIRRPDSAGHKIKISGMEDKEAFSVDLQATVAGPENAPEAVEMTGEIKLLFDYSRPVEFGGEDDEYLSTAETVLKLDMHSACTEGLWTTALNVDGSTVYEYGSESDKLQEVEPFELHYGYGEKEAPEGESSAAYSLVLIMGSEVFHLSFDLGSKRVPYEDAFGAMQVYPIDPNEESSSAQMLLMADIMTLSSDAMLLSAQDDVFAAKELLESINLYGEYVEVESVEAAKEYFDAPLPAFTPPAGYELDKIEAAVDGSCVDFYYWSETEGEAILASYFDFRGQAKYHGIDEAQLEKGPVVHSEVVDGLAYYIDVFTPEVNIYFTLNGVRAEEMDRILKGLDVVSLYLDEDELAAREEAGKRPL